MSVDKNDDDIGQGGTDAQKTTADAVINSEFRESINSVESLLMLSSSMLDDLESVRMATDNRIFQLNKLGIGATVEISKMADVAEGLKPMEHEATLELQRALRKHPLGPWVKAQTGIGEKQGARLLASIGWPGDRKTVSQLWAYCGLHVLNSGPQHPDDPQNAFGSGVDNPTSQSCIENHTCPVGGIAPKRRKGAKSNWNQEARMRVFLVAESCVKQLSSPYRTIYDAGREKYAESIHNHPCPQCGPSGKPALPGSPLSLGHQDARAKRLMMKEILKDMWIEAKRIEAEATA
jgi:hypothetical protein